MFQFLILTPDLLTPDFSSHLRHWPPTVVGAALSAAGSHRSHVAKTVAYISAGAAVGAVFDASRWYPQQQQSQQQQQPGSRALTLQQQQQQQQLQNVEAALGGALTPATQQQQQQQQRQQPAPAHVFRSHAQSIGGAGDSSASSTPLASSSLSSAPSARDVIDLPVSIKRALRLPPPPPDLGWMRSTTISTSPFYANHRDGGQRLRYCTGCCQKMGRNRRHPTEWPINVIQSFAYKRGKQNSDRVLLSDMLLFLFFEKNADICSQYLVGD
jgi:hypothetical protein